MVWPEVLAFGVENDRADRHVLSTTLLDGRRLCVQPAEQQLREVRLPEPGASEDERAPRYEAADGKSRDHLRFADLHPLTRIEPVASGGEDVLAQRVVPDRRACGIVAHDPAQDVR